MEAFLSSKFSDYRVNHKPTGDEDDICAPELEDANVSAVNLPFVAQAPSHHPSTMAHAMADLPLASASSGSHHNDPVASSHGQIPITGTAAQSGMQTDGTERNMVSILARFRDSEILGGDKDAGTAATTTSPTGLMHQQALLSASTLCPSICSRIAPQSTVRSQLFAPALLAQVPPSDYCHKALQIFLENTAWEIFVVSSRQILVEMAEFETLRAQGDEAEVDPAWLALLFNVSSI